jgi:serine/threonine protein kinase/tetratricopeptide (TPR) repeat protein
VTGVLPAYDSFGDRYEILELLGEGGMGRVYKAWDRDLEKVIALKTIRGEQARNPEILKRFKQELLLARKITHKNVIRIHDMGEAGGVRFFTMEYIPGDSLKARIEKLGKIPVPQAVQMAKQILGALEEAHEQGVVHRDLKPQNIMIDQDGVLHIMDFGIARSAMDTSGMTATGMIIGTPDYMSPEQARGEKAGEQSDLFSFGVILYEMLTGEVPFKGDTAATKVMMRLSHKPRPVREIDPAIPPYLESIVSKCLEVDRDLRYKTAKEVFADLERESVDRSPLLRLKRTIARHKVVAAISVALALASGAAVYYAGKSTTTAPQVAVTTLAVLPFSNASGDPSLDWLGSNLAQILTTEIGQSEQLQSVSSDRLRQVLSDLRIGSNASFDPDTIRRVGDFTSAQTVVSGQYVKLGEQIRIDATLHDLEEQRTVALKAEAANEGELLTAVGQLAQDVRDNLRVSGDVLKELQATAFRPSTESMEALRHYNLGLELARQGKYLEAVQEFEASTQEDPAFALAYSKLGQTYANLGYDERAEELTRQAVDLSNNLPSQERYLILANHARVMNDYDRAIESYQKLAEAAPSDPEVQFNLAGLYEESGKFDLARDNYQKVLAHDPNRLDALLALGRVEIQRGQAQDSLEFLNRALTLAIQLESDEGRATTLNFMGLAYKLLGRPDEALRYYQESLDIKRRIGDKRGTAASLNQMAQVEVTLGRVDDAQAEYDEALAIRREIGDRSGIGDTLIDLAYLYADRGDLDGALRLYKESLQIQRELGNERMEAMCLGNIGSIYLDQGNYGEALTYLELARGIRERLGNPLEIAETLHNLAETAAKTANYDQAIAHYLRALELSRKADDKQGVAIESYSLGRVFELQGRYGAALKAIEEALTIYRDLGERGFWLAEILSGHGSVLIQVGRSQEATSSLEESLGLARELENNTLIAQVLNSEGDGAFYRGDFPSASAHYQEALSMATEGQDQRLVLLSRLNLAAMAVETGRWEEGLDALKSVAKESDALGLKYLGAQCSLYIGRALLDSGDPVTARQELEGSLRSSERLASQTLLAKSHYYLAEALREEENEPQARRHFSAASQILEDIQKEVGSNEVLERADLKPLYAEASRWVEPGEN